MVLTETSSHLHAPWRRQTQPSQGPAAGKRRPVSVLWNCTENCWSSSLLLEGTLWHKSFFLPQDSCHTFSAGSDPIPGMNFRAGWTSATELFGRNSLEERRLVFPSSREWEETIIRMFIQRSWGTREEYLFFPIDIVRISVFLCILRTQYCPQELLNPYVLPEQKWERKNRELPFHCS